MAEGLEASKPFIKALVEAQQQLAAQASKETREFPTFPDYQPDAYEAVEGAAEAKIREAMTIADKQTRENRLDEVKAEVLAELAAASRAARRSCPPRSAR